MNSAPDQGKCSLGETAYEHVSLSAVLTDRETMTIGGGIVTIGRTGR